MSASADLRTAYERHLKFDLLVAPAAATERQRFAAFAAAVRDLLAERWLATAQDQERANPKRVYYLSLEYLPGRSLRNNIQALRIPPSVIGELASVGIDLDRLCEAEPDAALGNGGLGRLAACLLDSLATLGIPAMGYGLRYAYGMFRQELTGGRQTEHPDNWLRRPDPWEVVRHPEAVQAAIRCSFDFEQGLSREGDRRTTTLRGTPYDRPVVGYGAGTINTLRLWEAASPDFFDLDEFNHGDFFGAVHDKILAENVTRVLYPDDSTSAGVHLRFLQEFFLVACSLADIVRRFRSANADWRLLPDKVAIQLNDTHPSIAVAELMRILLDDALLGWDESWDLTVRTLAYTNHTLLPESLERWPVAMFELALPRHLEIIYEVNRRFLDDVRRRSGADEALVRRVSLIEEQGTRQVRMAHLAMLGTHSTNGVSAIHTRLLRERTARDFAALFPARFSNKTNGVSQRRWLLLANPSLGGLITEAIGDGWISHSAALGRLRPFAEDAAFRERYGAVKRAAKTRFAAWLRAATGRIVDPDSLFDSQIKRIHEYKRQLLNVLHIIILYGRLRDESNPPPVPRTFFFAGKAAPAYLFAKLVIRLIHAVAAVLDEDPAVSARLKVIFVPDYGVSLAERLIPASDVSEQISTAGYEASGTSNMKFMMNGALTVGTRDGSTIEIAQAVGDDNIFLFGLSAEQVAGSRGWYDPRWHYAHDPQTRAAIDLISSDRFSRGEPGLFTPIVDALLRRGDYYMHLADLGAYAATQERLGALYCNGHGWARRAIANVAAAGPFSSDRTAREYAAQIWGVPAPGGPAQC